MTDRETVEEFSQRAVFKLTGVLSLSPQYGVANPSEAWLSRQKELVEELPRSCLRPSSDVLSLHSLVTRGLMKVSEKHALPFVPSAAVLCLAHKALHPWRIRSLFLLLAGEVGIRSDRIRRFRGFDDGFAPSQAVQDFVYRMTSVASLWIAPEDFERRFGFAPPQELSRLESGCEACMLAVVGARAQLLVDLRANMIARRYRSHRNPALLRFVDAWIEWFGNGAELLMAESETLGNELRGIRREIGRRRHMKRKQARKEGNPVPHSKPRKAEKNAQGYPMPSPLRRPRSGSRSHGAAAAAAGLSSASREAGLGDGHNRGDEVENSGECKRYSAVQDNPFTSRPDGSGADNNSPFEFDDEDGLDEQDPNWADDIGSYYWDNRHPGARADWGRPTANAVHPAFRTSTNSEGGGGGGGGGGRRGSTLAPFSADRPIPQKNVKYGRDNDDKDRDTWTEPTLHTAGGRTNLNLAPPVPATPSLVNITRLTRDAAIDQNAPSSVYSTDGPASPHPPPPDAPQQQRRRVRGNSTTLSAEPSSRVTSFGTFMRHHDGTRRAADDAGTIRPEDSISTVGGRSPRDSPGLRWGGNFAGLYREMG